MGVAGGSGRHHLRGRRTLEQPSADDVGEVAAGGDGGGPPVAHDQVLELLSALRGPRVEGHPILTGGDHDQHESAVRHVVDHIEQRPQEGHVEQHLVVVSGGHGPYVIHYLVDQDEHRSPHVFEGFGQLGLVGRVILVGLVLLVGAVEQPPQEPLSEGPGRTVDFFNRGGVVAIHHHAMRPVQIFRNRSRTGDLTGLGEHRRTQIGSGQRRGARGEMPQPDQGVGLAPAHRLVEAPHRPCPSGRRRTQTHGYLSHESHETARRMRDRAIIERIVVAAATAGAAEHGIVQRHLDVVHSPGPIDDFLAQLHHLPPRSRARLMRGHDRILQQHLLSLPCLILTGLCLDFDGNGL